MSLDPLNRCYHCHIINIFSIFPVEDSRVREPANIAGVCDTVRLQPVSCHGPLDVLSSCLLRPTAMLVLCPPVRYRNQAVE